MLNYSPIGLNGSLHNLLDEQKPAYIFNKSFGNTIQNTSLGLQKTQEIVKYFEERSRNICPFWFKSSYFQPKWFAEPKIVSLS